MHASHSLLWGAVILSLVSSGALWYKQLSPGTASGSDGAAIEAWVKAHPDVIFSAVQQHLEGQQSASEEKSLEAIKANAAFLYEGDHPVIGNPEGDVTVVEFMDYNCGYCKKAYAPVSALIQKDKNVKVVLIELPILHETSALAARWALAANELGAYAGFHQALMEHRGPISEEVLSGFATGAGLDAAAVKTKSEDPKIAAIVNDNLQKATEMGIQGTPGFIIGDEVIRGYVELPAMEAAVAKAREDK